MDSEHVQRVFERAAMSGTASAILASKANGTSMLQEERNSCHAGSRVLGENHVMMCSKVSTCSRSEDMLVESWLRQLSEMKPVLKWSNTSCQTWPHTWSLIAHRPCVRCHPNHPMTQLWKLHHRIEDQNNGEATFLCSNINKVKVGSKRSSSPSMSCSSWHLYRVRSKQSKCFLSCKFADRIAVATMSNVIDHSFFLASVLDWRLFLHPKLHTTLWLLLMIFILLWRTRVY